MRIRSLRLPNGWLEKARQAALAVEQGADPNVYASVWRELKDNLAELLPAKKCWYCETPADRSDNAVDHFRPKGRVADARRVHEGYRWLAFDYMNYRYSCTFCNSKRIDTTSGLSGGKADRFPLLHEDDRVYVKGSVSAERPALLDPCGVRDWKLLGCKRENGHACSATDNPVDTLRVETSIDVYHLDYEPTCRLRHTTAVRFTAYIEQAKRAFEAVAQGTATEDYFETAASPVAAAIDRAAEFSGEMRFILKGERHSHHPWIDDLLEA